jgi:hypothetical protein
LRKAIRNDSHAVNFGGDKQSGLVLCSPAENEEVGSKYKALGAGI